MIIPEMEKIKVSLRVKRKFAHAAQLAFFCCASNQREGERKLKMGRSRLDQNRAPIYEALSVAEETRN